MLFKKIDKHYQIKNKMRLQRIHLLIANCILCFGALAQNNQPAAAALETHVSSFTYKTLNPLLKYPIIVNMHTTPNPNEGDQVTLKRQSFCNNKRVFTTTIAYKGNQGFVCV